MFTGHQRGERRLKLPGIEGVWFGTGRVDGSVLLRRHGKVSRKDAITDIIMRENAPAPGNSRFTFFVHTLGSNETLVVDSLKELSALAEQGRLRMPKAKGAKMVRVPHGWAAVVA